MSEAAEEHKNPDMVGYTASAETPDFHFRRIGTTSAATEYAQVTVKFNLVKLRKHINAIATTVQEAAALTPEQDGLQIHMFQQLNRELAILKDRKTYIYHMLGSPHQHHATHRHKRFVFTLAFVIMALAVASTHPSKFRK